MCLFKCQNIILLKIIVNSAQAKVDFPEFHEYVKGVQGGMKSSIQTTLIKPQPPSPVYTSNRTSPYKFEIDECTSAGS